MTYDIETIKRLVPEATEAGTYYEDGNKYVFFYAGGRSPMMVSHYGPGKLLLDTRRQLEIAREGLGEFCGEKSWDVNRRFWQKPSDPIKLARDTLQRMEEVK